MRNFIATLLLCISLSPSHAKSFSYEELVLCAQKSPAVEVFERMSRYARELKLSAEGALYPSIELSYSGAWLDEKPTMTYHMPPPIGSASAPMATTRSFESQLSLRYRLFSGFAISSLIEKREWQRRVAELKVIDKKRSIVMRLSSLYAQARMLESLLHARTDALAAVEAALKKARALYDNGMLPPSGLYNIEAALYDTKAAVADTENELRKSLETLSYISGERVDGTRGGIELPEPKNAEQIYRYALKMRADIASLEATLKIDSADIKLAKSQYFPRIDLEAALKRRGGSPTLEGDGYSNPNRSYLGFRIDWNLYSGGRTMHMGEAARYRKLASVSALIDYRRRVESEIVKAFGDLETLKKRLESAKMRIRSQKEYYELTRGRFDNGLGSADELSRAIADLAQARAAKASIEASIEMQRALVWLMGGLKSFERALTKKKKRGKR